MKWRVLIIVITYYGNKYENAFLDDYGYVYSIPK